jgi:hypothetical protein
MDPTIYRIFLRSRLRLAVNHANPTQYASELAPGEAARRDAQGTMTPINLGPGLLVYLDRLKCQGFLERWRRAMDRE